MNDAIKLYFQNFILFDTVFNQVLKMYKKSNTKKN